MDFSYSENQKMIAQMVRDFSEKEIRPHFMKWDESQEFPVPLFKKLGELGLMGVLVPTEYGGSGFGYDEYITVIDEIAQVCGSIGLSVAAHNSLCTGHIMYFGNEDSIDTGRVGGFARLAYSNLTYTKKIGLDIFDKYGEQFSFDLEVFAKYGPKGRNLNSVKAARLFR